jgi:5-formyltetrahydrofolate cyclo-ligase
MDGTKQAIRQEMRERRRALPLDLVVAAGRAVAGLVARWTPYRFASAVLLYVATDNEVPTDRLLEQAHADGKRVLLPRTDGSEMVFAEHRPGLPMRRGTLGIPEPAGEAVDPSMEPDLLVLAPLLAWDRTGARLGRGGGFYDGALAEAPPTWQLAGLGYGFQECEAIPTDPWDVRLDHVVIESGIVRCAGPNDGALTGKENTRTNGLDMGHRSGGAARGAARSRDRADPARAARDRETLGA